MREFYKDFYGCAASIRTGKDGKATLTVLSPAGKNIHHKTYDSKRGAKIAMGRLSEGWTKRGEWDC